MRPSQTKKKVIKPIKIRGNEGREANPAVGTATVVVLAASNYLLQRDLLLAVARAKAIKAILLRPLHCICLCIYPQTTPKRREQRLALAEQPKKSQWKASEHPTKNCLPRGQVGWWSSPLAGC